MVTLDLSVILGASLSSHAYKKRKKRKKKNDCLTLTRVNGYIKLDNIIYGNTLTINYKFWNYCLTTSLPSMGIFKSRYPPSIDEKEINGQKEGKETSDV